MDALLFATGLKYRILMALTKDWDLLDCTCREQCNQFRDIKSVLPWKCKMKSHSSRRDSETGVSNTDLYGKDVRLVKQ